MKQRFLIGMIFTVLFSLFTLASELPGYLSQRLASSKYTHNSGLLKTQTDKRSPLNTSGTKMRLDQEVGKMLDLSTDIWHYYVNNLYTYDDAGNMLTSIMQIYDDSTQLWVNHEKSINTYDNQNNQLSETILMWDEEGEYWSENYMNEYSYDANGNVTEEMIYYNYTDTLELNGRTRYIYNSSGQQIERYDDVWVDSSATWTESSKGVQSYDVNGNNTGYIQYYWYNENWDPSHQIEMNYDEQNRMTEEIYSYWNGTAWVSTTLYSYEYGEGPDPLAAINHYWDSYTTNDWVAGSKEDFSYDANGNQIRTVNSNWDDAWVEISKFEIVFDTTRSCDELILPSWFQMMPRPDRNMRVNEGHFQKDGENWVKTYDNDFFYTEVAMTGIRVQTGTPFRVYPNPTGNILYVNPGNAFAYNLEIFNVAGRRVMQHHKTGLSEFSMQDLPRGVYLVRITPFGQMPQTQRVILK
ncbi:MAG: T9SS type A sorting domain-containing protein [Candidatus Neomarinimicrobiota bacterium]|nr:T9SS type A sorting domain-containing protein [Candidatus Neomarinimicrobiota bacterium]MDX9780929.1 T9SS type A sorting domain-containing protein [bacterium]